MTFHDWLFTLGIHLTETPLGQDSWLWVLVLHLMFAIAFFMTGVRYLRESTLLVTINWLVAFIAVLLMVTTFVRTAPSLTWGFLLLYVSVILSHFIPPVRRLLMKSRGGGA